MTRTNEDVPGETGMGVQAVDEVARLPEPRGPWLASVYFVVYLAYLFWRPEGELKHWVTLVIIPWVMVTFLYLRGGESIREVWGSFGLRRGGLLRGMGATLILGVVLGLVQVSLSRSGPAFLEAVSTGRALYMFPLAFVLMLLTAGFTEEFFFRGFLQTRLESLTRSRWLGLLLASVLFGLYHLPYAYLNPHWPSHGDRGAAVGAALGQAFPAMTLIRFAG
jgi:membrane protease YdiL (CAAX protease family)